MSDVRIERVIAMAERLIEALAADIAALENGEPRKMRTIETDFQQLAVQYGREAAGLNPDFVRKHAPAQVYAKLRTVTQRLRELLLQHARLLTRIKNASEGMIRAVAEEVDRRRIAARPYAPKAAYAPQPAAMIYNSVV
jgi:hypothetical protein